MAAVFDLAKTRIGNKRDQVEEALREKIDKFETKASLIPPWIIGNILKQSYIVSS